MLRGTGSPQPSGRMSASLPVLILYLCHPFPMAGLSLSGPGVEYESGCPQYPELIISPSGWLCMYPQSIELDQKLWNLFSKKIFQVGKNIPAGGGGMGEIGRRLLKVWNKGNDCGELRWDLTASQQEDGQAGSGRWGGNQMVSRIRNSQWHLSGVGGGLTFSSSSVPWEPECKLGCWGAAQWMEGRTKGF